MLSHLCLTVFVGVMLLVEMSAITLSQTTSTTLNQPSASTTAPEQPKDPIIKDANEKTDLMKNILAIFGSLCAAWLALRNWIKDKFTRFMERRNAWTIKKQQLQGHYDGVKSLGGWGYAAILVCWRAFVM